MQEVCPVYNVRSSVSLTMAYNHRFCRYVQYITCSDKHVIGMVYAVKVCSDTMRLRVSISESLAKRVNCLDTRLAGNKNRLEDDSHPDPSICVGIETWCLVLKRPIYVTVNCINTCSGIARMLTHFGMVLVAESH